MLKRVTHKGEKRIALYLPYSKENLRRAKSIPGARWSKTLKCWHYPDNKDTLDYLRNVFTEFIKVKEKEETKARLSQISDSHENAIKAFGKWMEQKRYSDNTVNTYTALLRMFFRYHRAKEIGDITEKDIIRFNQNYILRNNFSTTTQNQLINALKLFYYKYSNKNLDLDNLERPKKEKKLPEVFSQEEVQGILNSVVNLKHKTLLSLIYSAGLRIGEALNIKLKDLDSKRKMLHIHQGKGKKDRYIPLSDKILEMIIKYYKLYKPKEYLFEGQNGGRYTETSARQVFKKALKRAGIKKRATLHTLRHSYATHLLENGTDIRLIQELLGHNSPKTTMIYTHVSTSNLSKIENPFDKLNIL